MRSISMVLVVSLLWATTPAWSEDIGSDPIRPWEETSLATTDAPPPNADPDIADTSEAELRERIRALQRERDDVSLGGPNAAISIGGLATVLSVATIAITGAVCGSRWSDCGGTSNDDIIYGVSGAALGAGLVSIVWGVTERGNRRQRRSDLNLEMEQLENRLGRGGAPRVGIGVVAAGRPGLSLRVDF